MALPIRFARAGDFPNVANMGSISVVLLAKQKPVWVASVAAGLSFRADMVFVAA
jgi:hypothetical protein